MDVVAQMQLVLRLTLGLIFLASALAKFREPAAFVRGVLEYQLLPASLARAYGRLLPYTELATGLLLLSGAFFVVATGLATLLLTTFSVATAFVAARGRVVSCHCFGATGQGSRVGWHTFGRDVVLLLPTLWLFGNGAARGPSVQPWSQYNSGAIAAGVVLALGLALSYVLVAEGLDVLVSLAGQRGVEG